jgi:uncharacterized protein YbaP (TraB family)
MAMIWGLAASVHAQGELQGKEKKNFLWSVANRKNVIYLLGSVHFLSSESFPLADAIEKAYVHSNKVVFETDMAGFNDPAFQARTANLGLLPEGQTLQHYVSRQTYSSLEKKIEKLGVSMELFDRFRPWLCALTLAAMELQRLGLNPNYGVDNYYFNKARVDGKEVSFLESVDDQLRLFTEMNKMQEESFLKQTLEDLDVLEAKLSELIEAWASGDTQSLGSIVGLGFKDHPEIYKRMVVQRNRNWVTQINDLIQKGDNALVIVGAAHLVGNENVLSLLRSKGYKIEQK